MNSIFLSFEGGEACGKSTQIELLAERLNRAGRKTLVLREPGGTPLGEKLRHILKFDNTIGRISPEAELLLMNASRAQLVTQVIRPALRTGVIVIADRFYDSTTAYQGYGRQLPLAHVAAAINTAVGGTHPQITLLLHLNRTKTLARLKRRNAKRDLQTVDRFEQEKEAFFRRVEAGYLRIAENEPHRVKLIDADGTPAEVHTRIYEQLTVLTH